MTIRATLLERNAFWFGCGALVAVACLCALAYLPDPTCNVAYIKVQGDLVTYPTEYGTTVEHSSQSHLMARVNASESATPNTTDSPVTASEDVTSAIRDADDSFTTKAIVLEIDSPGGSPVAGEEIADALQHVGKPTIALIRDEGDSAAYMAATGASKIYASQFSSVGDIGITSSYVDQSKEDEVSGITFNQLSVGEYKDLGNPDKPLTDAERTLEQSELQKYYEDFVALVAKNRHISITTVTTLADGASMTAADAKTAGLIDAIGGYEQVNAYLGEKLHTDVKFCEVN